MKLDLLPVVEMLFPSRRDEVRREWGMLPTLPQASDPRNLAEGALIPSRGYADQPYVVGTRDGAWLCVLTTGAGAEGERGQHLVTLRSADQGKRWEEPVEVEPPSGPEASWGVLLTAPSGRIFVFYVFNGDDLRELPLEGGGTTERMDSHGDYVFRWSDDHGRSWSPARATIPVREFEIDRRNTTGGEVRLFWNVGRPVVVDGAVVLTLHKVRAFGDSWFLESEGALVRSVDLLSASAPAAARWETLPEGEHGLRTPAGGGPIAEEQSLAVLGDGSLLAVYRSVDGHPVGAYSRDGGRAWGAPAYLRYADGRELKHPRAACFAWRLESGGYVCWFHNHGGRFVAEHPQRPLFAYADRNPVWMARGWEIATPRGTEVVWGNPEIVLYDDDPHIRISYPDLIEDGGAIYLTETQKTTARVHRVSDPLAKALRHGPAAFDAVVLRREALLDWKGGPAALPSLPSLRARDPQPPHGFTDRRQGWSVELELRLERDARGLTLARFAHSSYGGMELRLDGDGALRASLSDGRQEFSWASDSGAWGPGRHHHAVAIFDGGAKVVAFVVDGRLCDGGEQRQFGWGRIPAFFRRLPDGLPLEAPRHAAAAVERLRIYPRALLAAEAEALFRGFSARPDA